jgi:hypothetical protein
MYNITNTVPSIGLQDSLHAHFEIIPDWNIRNSSSSSSVQ